MVTLMQCLRILLRLRFKDLPLDLWDTSESNICFVTIKPVFVVQLVLVPNFMREENKGASF